MEPAKPPSAPMDLRPFGLLGVAVAMVLATYIASSTWERVRVRPVTRTIEVTGSAKKRIVSDLIEWSATVEAEAKDRAEAYKILHDHAGRVQTFLRERGVAEAPGGGDEAAVALEGVGGAAAGGEELDGDRPLGLDVPGAIDLPDAAAAERLAELIAAGDDRAWAMLLRARQASP